MVFRHAIELGGQVVVIAGVRQHHRLRQMIGGQALVHPAHGLVPEELDRVAVARGPGLDLGLAGQRRPVRAQHVFRVQAQHMVNARQQHLGVAVFLAPDREDVEQGRPDNVLHADSQVRKPEGDGIIGVGRRVGDLHRQAGDAQGLSAPKRRGRCHMARCERCVARVAEEKAQPHVDRAVGPIGWQP